MGSVGDGLDNAVAESFFAYMQTDMLDRRRTRDSRTQLANAMFESIELVYNRQRCHSTLGCKTPVDYDRTHPYRARGRGLTTKPPLSAQLGELHLRGRTSSLLKERDLQRACDLWGPNNMGASCRGSRTQVSTGSELLRDTLWKEAYAAARDIESVRQSSAPIALVPKRRTVLQHLIRVRGTSKLTSHDVLVDYNYRKLATAQKVFCRDLTILDPYRVALPLKSKLRLVSCLMLGSSALARCYVEEIGQAVAKLAVADTTIYVCNPYHMVHLAPTTAELRVVVFFLNKDILLRNGRFFAEAVAVHAPRAVLEHWASSGPELVPVTPDHAFSTSEECIAFYFTDLAVLDGTPSEQRLAHFAVWTLDRARVPVRIFLHYMDTQSGDWQLRLENQGFPELVPYVVIPNGGKTSLHKLSTRQVSFSGASSIGGELMSLGVNHRVLDGPESETFEDLARSAGLALTGTSS